MKKPSHSEQPTSWQEVHRWYDGIVGKSGHHYHQTIILPNTLRLLSLEKDSSLLDLACGQGILERHIPNMIRYVGIDASKDLIKSAKTYTNERKNHEFIVGDVTKSFPLPKETKFSHAACILALQNIESPDAVFKNLTLYLKPKARFVIVINHPSFRIPRQSHWGFDEKSKLQYRQVNSYMSAQKIPIQAHPGQKESKEVTWSFHYPLSSYSLWLNQNHFAIERIEEWCSDKTSTGKAAKWENRAREEFPLFLALLVTYNP